MGKLLCPVFSYVCASGGTTECESSYSYIIYVFEVLNRN
ncbi:hypothetical protein PMAL9190_01501 [Photobacterium malacitanum]|uniref:Uncharacterized protein n=1 Tax=Photobacterium malacitanum TaxID=2204294 RepID=A0A1Y6MEB8_9GAMM|nr:hypothetical protein PMAL9190_01501 [Photobacterium malacitanum]